MQKEKNNMPYFEDEESKLHPNSPIVERETINAILWNPKTNQVLCLDWGKFGWRTFVIGGVEDGEDPKETAKREIEEETGYGKIELISDLGRLKSAYFAAHKNQNRIAHTTGFLFKLVSDEQKSIDASNLPHTFHWINKDEVSQYLTSSSQKYLWNKSLESGYIK